MTARMSSHGRNRYYDSTSLQDGRSDPRYCKVMKSLRSYRPYIRKKLEMLRESAVGDDLEYIEALEDWLAASYDINADREIGVDTLEQINSNILEFMRRFPLDLGSDDDEEEETAAEAPESNTEQSAATTWSDKATGDDEELVRNPHGPVVEETHSETVNLADVAGTEDSIRGGVGRGVRRMPLESNNEVGIRSTTFDQTGAPLRDPQPDQGVYSTLQQQNLNAFGGLLPNPYLAYGQPNFGGNQTFMGAPAYSGFPGQQWVMGPQGEMSLCPVNVYPQGQHLHHLNGQRGHRKKHRGSRGHASGQRQQFFGEHSQGAHSMDRNSDLSARGDFQRTGDVNLNDLRNRIYAYYGRRGRKSFGRGRGAHHQRPKQRGGFHRPMRGRPNSGHPRYFAVNPDAASMDTENEAGPAAGEEEMIANDMDTSCPQEIGESCSSLDNEIPAQNDAGPANAPLSSNVFKVPKPPRIAQLGKSPKQATKDKPAAISSGVLQRLRLQLAKPGFHKLGSKKTTFEEVEELPSGDNRNSTKGSSKSPSPKKKAATSSNGTVTPQKKSNPSPAKKTVTPQKKKGTPGKDGTKARPSKSPRSKSASVSPKNPLRIRAPSKRRQISSSESENDFVDDQPYNDATLENQSEVPGDITQSPGFECIPTEPTPEYIKDLLLTHLNYPAEQVESFMADFDGIKSIICAVKESAMQEFEVLKSTQTISGTEEEILQEIEPNLPYAQALSRLSDTNESSPEAEADYLGNPKKRSRRSPRSSPEPSKRRNFGRAASVVSDFSGMAGDDSDSGDDVGSVFSFASDRRTRLAAMIGKKPPESSKFVQKSAYQPPTFAANITMGKVKIEQDFVPDKEVKVEQDIVEVDPNVVQVEREDLGMI